MRRIKMALLGLLAVALVLVGVANMGGVDLYLMPAGLGGDRFSLKGVPLAVVILVAAFVGVVFGLISEWLRERRHRALAEDKRRELAELRQENAQLRTRLADRGESLPRRPAA